MVLSLRRTVYGWDIRSANFLFLNTALAMIALTSSVRRCMAETRTGAAFTLFVVNVAAATVGCGEWINAISGRLSLVALMPQ